MSCNAVVPKRAYAVLIALALVLGLSGTYAAAQETVYPKNEVYVGYAWLHPNGSVDWGKVPDITNGFDASITHYLPSIHNLGIVVDGSYHWNNSNNLSAPCRGKHRTGDGWHSVQSAQLAAVAVRTRNGGSR